MTGRRQALLVAGGVLLAFAIGFGWQWSRAEGLEDELAETRRALVFARLEGTLGAAAVEAARGNYEIARQLASDFFSGLQIALDEAPPDAAAALAGILAGRDQVITFLSRGDPASAGVLARDFQRFRFAIGRAEQAPAGPGPAPEPAAEGETAGAVPAPAEPR